MSMSKSKTMSEPKSCWARASVLRNAWFQHHVVFWGLSIYMDGERAPFVKNTIISATSKIDRWPHHLLTIRDMSSFDQNLSISPGKCSPWSPQAQAGDCQGHVGALNWALCSLFYGCSVFCRLPIIFTCQPWLCLLWSRRKGFGRESAQSLAELPD